MSFSFAASAICLWLGFCFPAAASTANSEPDFNFKPDSDSLVELTHWTAQGFLESGITNQTADSRVVFALASDTTSIQQVLSNTSIRTPVILVTGKAPPVRRKDSQPLVTIIAADGNIALNAISSLPVNLLNQAAPYLESITGRRLFPYRIIASDAEVLNTGQAPFVIYDVSRGDIHISTRFVQSWVKLPEQLHDTIHDVLFKAVGSVQKDLLKNGTSWSSSWMEDMVTLATATMTSGIMATVRTKPPLWFCFACPIVLGEFFPFFFNLGLGHIAQLVCDRYKLPDEECLDLWLGAIALALVLSLSSVVVIISICRIRECASPNSR